MRLAENPLCNPSCRACHYKELDYPQQLDRKRRWAHEQLGGWDPALQEIIPAPEVERLGYRSKSWLRSSFESGRLSFGMLRAVQRDGSWEKEFISWDTCPLHIGAIPRTLERLATALVESARELAETDLVGVWVGSPHLVVVSRSREAEPTAWKLLRGLDWSTILEPPFTHAWFHVNPQAGKHVFGHKPILPLYGEIAAGTAHPIKAFRQVAQSLLADARQEAVATLLEPGRGVCPRFILDLYCGTGELSLLLPDSVGWIGVELAREAVRYANTLRAASPARLHASFVGTVEDRLNDPEFRSLFLEGGTYSLYLNPPRSGLSPDARERVLQLIAQKRPLRIVYLSCSASSLKRDLVALESAGYRVESLRPYDFFPQTEHFETLACLSAVENQAQERVKPSHE